MKIDQCDIYPLLELIIRMVRYQNQLILDNLRQGRIMGIVSSEILINRPEGDGISVREEHIDHLSASHFINYRAESGYDVDARLAEDAVKVEADLSQQEIQQWIAEMEAGGDPAHIDMGGWFEHSVPDFNTWEDALDGSLTPILQSTYMQDILICKLTCDRLTKQELEAVAGKNNDVLGEQAIASNTQNELDSYIPLIDEEGNPRP